MPAWLKDFLGDRIQINSVLIVLCFASVLALSSQSAASYSSYILALSMIASFRRWNDVFRLRLFWLMLILLAYLSLSVFWSQPFSWRSVLGIFSRSLLVLTFVVALAECQLRGDVQRWLGRVLAIVGTGSAVAAIVFYLLEPPVGGRLSGLGQLDNPVVVGLVLGAVLVMLGHMLMTDDDLRWRWIACIGSISVCYAIYLSGSRNATVSSILGVMVVIFSTRIRDPQRFAAAAVTLLTVAGSIFAALAVSEVGGEVLFPRGDSFRLDIWARVFERVMAEGPIFGLGISTPDMVPVGERTFSHPHNMYLAVLFQGGIVASFLFVALVIGCTASLFSAYNTKSAKLGLGLLTMAMSSYFLDGHELIDKVGETWFLFWLPVGIALGLTWVGSLAVDHGDDI